MKGGAKESCRHNLASDFGGMTEQAWKTLREQASEVNQEGRQTFLEVRKSVGTSPEFSGKGDKRMLHELEKAIGHSFRDISLLENALAHSSYANEMAQFPAQQ